MAWHNKPIFKSALTYKPFIQYYSHTHRVVDCPPLDYNLGNENWKVGDYVWTVWGIGTVTALDDNGINVFVAMEEKVEGRTIELLIEYDSIEKVEKKPVSDLWADTEGSTTMTL